MLNKFKKKITEHTPLTDDNWSVLKTNCKTIEVKKNESLVNYAERDKNFYFIAKGSFVISLISNNGESKTVWFFLDNLFDIMGCLDSIFLDEPTKYEIRAIEDSIVVKFSRKSLDSWIEKNPQLSEFVRKDVLNDLVFLFEIRNHMTSHSPLQFIEYLKEKFPIILERVPNKHIAEFMGITPEWFSKMKRKIIDLN